MGMKTRPRVTAAVPVMALILGLLTVPVATSARAAGPLQCDVTPNSTYTLPPSRSRVADVSTVADTWAGHPVPQSVLTTSDAQYVAYYNAARQMTVAKRDLPLGVWQDFTLTSTLNWDSHNSVTLALDSTGHLHVSGNMHADPLVYFRTTVAGDITSLASVSKMVSTSDERTVTYPTFITLPDGQLVFRYRKGSSGNGNTFYNVYNTTTKTWTRLLSTALLDGQGQRNAYADGPALGPDGYFHMVWVWREGIGAETTHTVSHAKSPDLLNWFTADGVALTLPITLATGGVVVDPVAEGGGVINNNVRVGFDANGTPIVSYHKYDANDDSQVFVARPSGNGWTTHQVTGWSGKWAFSGNGTLEFQIQVGPPAPLPDGNLRIDVTCAGDARTIIVDGSSLAELSEIDTPPLPGGMSQTSSSAQAEFPTIRPNIYADRKASDATFLRWESMPANGDLPRSTYPSPQPLQVIRLGAATTDTATDHVDFGNSASESAHSVIASAASGVSTESAQSRRYVTNLAGEYFQAVVAVPAGLPAALRIDETYPGAVTREYDVLVNGQVVAHRLHTATGAGVVSFDVDLPAALTGTGSVAVRFQPSGVAGPSGPSITDLRTFAIAATDIIDLGSSGSESQHGLTASASSGSSIETGVTRRYVPQADGGFFEFTLVGVKGMDHVLTIDETYGANLTREYDVFADGVKILHRVFARTGGPGVVSYNVVVPASSFADGSARIRITKDQAGANAGPSITAIVARPSS